MSDFGVETDSEVEFERVVGLQVASGTAPDELSGERLVGSALVAAVARRSATLRACWVSTLTKRVPETSPPTETEKVLSVSDEVCEARVGRPESYAQSQCVAE